MRPFSFRNTGGRANNRDAPDSAPAAKSTTCNVDTGALAVARMTHMAGKPVSLQSGVNSLPHAPKDATAY